MNERGFAIGVVVLLSAGSLLHAAESLPSVASELYALEDYAGAAVEFRRAALQTHVQSERSAWYAAAGEAYLRGGETGRAVKMLDLMEDAAADFVMENMLLRAEVARRERDWGNAVFYYGAMRRRPDDAVTPALREYAVRGEAGARLRSGDLDGALEAAAELSVPVSGEAVAAIEKYRAGRDKRPWLGGLLGLIPGLGYLYAGEPANALRSLILNSLFIYAMVDTAEKEQWGAFAAVTFFEITWYSGSIYGGIDASYRYNQRRLEDAAGAVESDGRLGIDRPLLPLLVLSVAF